MHIFQVTAGNRLGQGNSSDRTAVRTLAKGAQPLSSWVEVIDERANKLFYCHSKTNAVSLSLPIGAPLDEEASFKNKRKYLQTEMDKKMMRACERFNVTQRVLQVAVQRENILEASLRILLHTPAEEIDGGPIRVRFHGEEGMDAGGTRCHSLSSCQCFGLSLTKLYDALSNTLSLTLTLTLIDIL